MWNAFFSALSAFACLLCILSLWSAARNAAAVRDLRAAMTRWQEWANSLPRNSSSTSFEARLSEVEETLATVANRVKMQKVRNAAEHATATKPTGLPDPYLQPDEWRAAVNAKLSRSKFGLT